MITGKYTPERWAYNNYELRVVREAVWKWLRKVPAMQFRNYTQQLSDDNGDKLYSDRYGKSCFLAEIRSASHLCEIANLLCSLDSIEDPLATFLCSRVSLKNWRCTKALILYVENDDYAESLSNVYDERLDEDINHITRYYDHEWITVTREKVAPEDILRIPEYCLL